MLTEYIKVRISKNDRRLLEQYCKANDTDISKVIRKLLYTVISEPKA